LENRRFGAKSNAMPNAAALREQSQQVLIAIVDVTGNRNADFGQNQCFACETPLLTGVRKS
jgi:hypothetical protein